MLILRWSTSMETFLTFALRALVLIGAFMLSMAALAHFGFMNYGVRVGETFEDRTPAYAFEALSQSLLLFFFAYIAYRVRNKLRHDRSVSRT